MKTNQNYQQQQINGRDQTVILDPALTAETDEMNASFPTSGPPVDPRDKDDENFEDMEEDSSKEHIDEEFPSREDLGDGEDDPGLNHDENDDLSLNIDNDDDELY